MPLKDVEQLVTFRVQLVKANLELVLPLTLRLRPEDTGAALLAKAHLAPLHYPYA
jgi:hypothetical protein